METAEIHFFNTLNVGKDKEGNLIRKPTEVA
jgi:hypothetical protein